MDVETIIKWKELTNKNICSNILYGNFTGTFSKCEIFTSLI